MAQDYGDDWCQIPPDLLASIAKNLQIYGDYIRLRSVCVNWRSWLPPSPPHRLPCQLPWLLLPPLPPTATFHCNPRHLRHQGSSRSFYDLLNGKINSLTLPEASYPRRICGSSHGWLVLVGDTPEIFCQNPLTGAKVFLSPLSTLPCVVSFSFSNVGREYSVRDPISGEIYAVDLRQMRDFSVRKVILSHSPTNRCPFVALGIISSTLTATSELVFCKSGENCWKSVPGLGLGSGFYTEDVIYCEPEGQFYAVNKVGDVAVFNLSSDSPVIIRTVDTIQGDLPYLVKSGRELLLVSRSLDAEANIVAYCEVYETIGFDVYRFREVGDGRAYWDKLTVLGDRILFIGENSSLALSASDFPGSKGNCIYFTDDHSKSNDVGIFDLASNCIEPLPCYPSDSTWPLYWASPIWLTPNPC